MQPNHRPWKHLLKRVSGLSYKNSYNGSDQCAPAAEQPAILGIRTPKYAALPTPTAPITALNITQIHGLHGIRPINNSGVMLAHAA
ncbi:hypothetical protein D3C71_1989040 [compost metagenome]